MKNIKTQNGEGLYYISWLPEINPKGIIQISHGMAEHSGSYEELGNWFSEQGFAVFANDHIGHGKNAVSDQAYGHIPNKSGWNSMLADMHRLTGIIRKEYPEIPFFLLGHSMGSFLVRDYICRWGEDIDGTILSATSGSQPLLSYLGLLVARREIKKFGEQHRSKRLTSMTFGKYNKKFKPNRTEYDWLSRDEKKVDEYIADNRCGGVFTAGFFAALLNGIRHLDKHEELHHIPHSMSFLFLTGEQDALSGFGQRVWNLIDQFERNGLFDIEAVFYPDSRHDLKLELNREMVFKDVLTWIMGKLKEWES